MVDSIPSISPQKEPPIGPLSSSLGASSLKQSSGVDSLDAHEDVCGKATGGFARGGSVASVGGRAAAVVSRLKGVFCVPSNASATPTSLHGEACYSPYSTSYKREAWVKCLAPAGAWSPRSNMGGGTQMTLGRSHSESMLVISNVKPEDGSVPPKKTEKNPGKTWSP